MTPRLKNPKLRHGSVRQGTWLEFHAQYLKDFKERFSGTNPGMVELIESLNHERSRKTGRKSKKVA